MSNRKMPFARRAFAAALAFAATVASAAPGDLDPTFGIGGVVRTNTGYTGETYFAALANPDGSAYVAGELGIGERTSVGNLTVRRLRADGTYDLGFGAFFGLAFFDSGFLGGDVAYALARQADGRVLAAGSVGSDNGIDFAVVRFLADGTLDSTFGNGDRVGLAKLDLVAAGGFDGARGVAVQSSGRIVAAATADSQPMTPGTTPSTGFGVVGLTPVGRLDATFATGGLALPATHTGDEIEIPLGIARESDGTLAADDAIVVYGGRTVIPALAPATDVPSSKGTSRYGGVVRRYRANGTPDETYGTGGSVFLPAISYVAAALLQADGKLALVGSTFAGELVFMRLRPDGSLDTTFGTNGITTVVTERPMQVNALAQLPGGGLVALARQSLLNFDGAAKGLFEDIGRFVTVQVTQAGALDAAYGGGDGMQIYFDLVGRPNAIVRANGSLLIAGSLKQDRIGDSDTVLARLERDDALMRDGFESPR